jgi:hypothetical protein
MRVQPCANSGLDVRADVMPILHDRPVADLFEVVDGIGDAVLHDVQVAVMELVDGTIDDLNGVWRNVAEFGLGELGAADVGCLVDDPADGGHRVTVRLIDL